MNNKTLLSRKRNKSDSKEGSDPFQNIHSYSPIVQFNGFNIIELYYTEYLENKNELNINEIDRNNIIELKESNHSIHENNENNVEIIEMTRTKAKNIEDYYTTKFGISTIKENCFNCYMTNFISNELLYFNCRKDLFNYIKYCFVTKNKILFTNEDIYKENKDNFFNVNSSFLNGWRFFIPKTICKGCFMDIINKKHLIYNIKNIFSDIERDSLCRTNYRNYALFSPRFRAAFSLRSRSKHSRRPNRNIIRNNKNRSNRSNSINISKNKKSGNKAKIYNLDIKYEENKNILIINKNILDNSIIDMIKRNTSNSLNEKNFKINNNNNLLNDNKSNINKDETLNNSNNLTCQGQNNTNIINNKNINNNLSNDNSINNLNIDIINNTIKELLDKIYFNFKNFISNLENIKNKIHIISIFINHIRQKIVLYFIYPYLLKFTQIKDYINALYISFNDDIQNLNLYLTIAKSTSEESLKYLSNITNEIKKNKVINLKEKNNLLSVIKELHSLIEENKKKLGQYEGPFNNFINNYKCLIRLISEITN